MAQASSRAAASTRTATLPPDVDLHARPAADFVRTAMGFEAAITVSADGREENAKSLLSVLALGAKGGTELTLTATGEDADAALDALTERARTLSD